MLRAENRLRGDSEDWVGNTVASEILGVAPANVRKMLLRRGVEGEIVTQGSRKVHVYLRTDVERVAAGRRKKNVKRA